MQGGGNLFILAPSDVEQKLEQLRRAWNQWLLQKFSRQDFSSLG